MFPAQTLDLERPFTHAAPIDGIGLAQAMGSLLKSDTSATVGAGLAGDAAPSAQATSP